MCFSLLFVFIVQIAYKSLFQFMCIHPWDGDCFICIFHFVFLSVCVHVYASVIVIVIAFVIVSAFVFVFIKKCMFIYFHIYICITETE